MTVKQTKQELWETYKEVLRSRRRVLVATVIVALFLCITLQQTGAIESLEDRIGRPALFNLRESLGAAPKLDPRLVIYAYNDDAVSEWGRPELLSGRQWDQILKAITDHNPKAILIDMIFGNSRKDTADVAAMNRAFKRNVPIYTGVAVLPSPLQKRKPFRMTGDDFTARPEDLEFLKKYQGTESARTPYGPHDNLPQLHTNVGQINFRVPGFFKPLITFPPDKFLKHMALSTLDKSMIKIDGASLYLNGEKISLNADGEAIVNWSSKKSYAENTFRILDLVEIRQSGEFSTRIRPDSIVLLLPLMFTGNADFKTTHVGQLAGGYVQAAILNSALTGKWVQIKDLAYVGILFGVFFGFFGALIRRNYAMIFYALGANVLFLLVVAALFITAGWLVEWLNVIIAFNFTLLPVIILSAVSEEIRSIRMNDALTGVLSPKMLEQISKSRNGFALSAVEQTVTVMFVDFVGFSTVAEQLPSRVVFESLKKHFSDLGKIIHKYHGIVDKSLGDGLLGVFGFDPVTREVSNTHAEDALLCSIEIQKLIADECANYKKSDYDRDAVIFSARVGLNTGTVFIGNIGDDGRLDLTVIGHTVNMGKRYEDACEPFKIMLGQSTQQYLSGNLKNKLTKRDIQIKHHKELVHAFEFDPFEDSPKLYSSALHHYREFSKISRSSERLMVPSKQLWEIWQAGVKTGAVIDYSEGGVCVDLMAFYGNKVAVTLDLRVKSSTDGRVLHEIKGLHATVKWGRKSDAGYRHGLLFTDESAAKFDAVIAAQDTFVQ